MRSGLALTLSLFSAALAKSPLEPLFTADRLNSLQNRSKALFFHGWNNYVDHALPADELRPLSCSPVGPDTADPLHFGRNDVMGNFSLTLIDALDTLPLLGEQALFEHYVQYIKDHVSFDQPSIVQVFEVNIRVIGGLLSAHILASVPKLGHSIPHYDGHLLTLAQDMATRLLPAFDSPTGIAYPRVHLQDGFVPIAGHYHTETTSAGAGSLLLEFGLLSRLTGDPLYENLARRSFFQVWNRRSKRNLLGMALDASSGRWLEPYTTIGASVDSFYEYALKYGLLFDDSEVMKVWKQAYDAVNELTFRGIYRVVHMESTATALLWSDALSAFWSGLQVLWGDIDFASLTNMPFYKLWNAFGGIPERWKSLGENRGQIELEWYLLRPEFVESVYYLYQATEDPFYLQIGEAILDDLEAINLVDCGVAGIQDVRNGTLSDRMDSFFLSETVKYLYLLFTPDHSWNRNMANMVFSTEAHPFWLDAQVLASANLTNYPAARPATSQPKRKRKLGDYFRKFNNLHNKLSRKFSSAAIPKRSGQNQHVCEAHSHQPIQTIVSWRSFYDLDWYMPLEKPSWLYRTTDIETHHGFYDIYVNPGAICRNLEL